jgi:hypothetical protein
MRTSIVFFLVITFVGMLGCSAAKVYQGPTQPPETLATVKSAVSLLTATPFAVELRKIDGVAVSKYTRSVALLPGSHSLEVVCYLERDGVLLPYYTGLQLVVEAKKVYQLYSIKHSDSCEVAYDVSLK